MRKLSLLSFLLLVLLTIAARAQEIKVTLLGTGSPVISGERFGPATLVQAGQETLLFDVGRGASIRLSQAGVLPSQITDVFLTHLHSDHISGIGDLYLGGWLFPGRSQPFRIEGPVGTTALMSNLMTSFALDIGFRLGAGLPSGGQLFESTEIVPGEVLYRNGVKVTAFLVEHGDAVPAYGYRIDYLGRSVVISGDTVPNENVIRFATGADLLVHEVLLYSRALLDQSASARAQAAPHTNPQQAGIVFARAQPRLAVFTHVAIRTLPGTPLPTPRDILRGVRENYRGPVIVGEDLMTIEIGRTIRVRRPGFAEPLEY